MSVSFTLIGAGVAVQGPLVTYKILIVLAVLIVFIVFFQGHLDVHGPGIRTAKQL